VGAEGAKAASPLSTARTGSGALERAKAWTKDLNRWFTGRTVYICEDHDKTGRNHVNEVARALKGIATEIRIVEFHDLPEHGDVSDWLQQHTAAQLLARAKAGRLPSKGYELVRAEDVLPRNIDWLWYGHLAANTLELLAGVPGAGKSQIQDSYVASVTTGNAWPDGANGQGRRNVIMLTAEDVVDDTLVPRLIAAGADRTRVRILNKIHKDDKGRMFLLAEDLDALEDAIIEVGDVGLVTIDRTTAYMGRINSHMATDVRAQLGPLKDFSERVGVGISAITHPPKNAGPKALDQFIGSQAYIAAARIGHLCVEEIEQEAIGARRPTGRMLYTRAKHTPTKAMMSLAYRIADASGGIDHRSGRNVETSKIIWEGPVDVTADEAIAATATRKDHSGAVMFLMDMLANGPVPKTLIDERAAVRGFSEDQLKRAKAKTGIVAQGGIPRPIVLVPPATST
jgi:putative DNA primase/helicase